MLYPLKNSETGKDDCSSLEESRFSDPIICCTNSETQKKGAQNVTKAEANFSRKVHVETRLSLCNYCSKATPLLCEWIGKGNRTGLKYKSKIKEHGKHRKQEEVVKVTNCERFKKGSLPPLRSKEVAN